MAGVFLLARLSLTNICQNCLLGNKVIASMSDPGRETRDVRAHTHQLFPYRVNVHQQSVPGAGDAAVDQTGSVPSVLAPCSVS